MRAVELVVLPGAKGRLQESVNLERQVVMKLRIRGNSLRLRLTVSEVEAFGKSGEVSDHIDLGVGQGSRLTYTLAASDEVGQVLTGFRDNRIIVTVPIQTARSWVENEDVGFTAKTRTADKTDLDILIEKDFACLKTRAGEDDSDTFPHPQAKAAC